MMEHEEIVSLLLSSTMLVSRLTIILPTQHHMRI